MRVDRRVVIRAWQVACQGARAKLIDVIGAVEAERPVFGAIVRH
jgi:hypothetical protein